MAGVAAMRAGRFHLMRIERRDPASGCVDL
jgi:hypothetical protein